MKEYKKVLQVTLEPRVDKCNLSKSTFNLKLHIVMAKLQLTLNCMIISKKHKMLTKMIIWRNMWKDRTYKAVNKTQSFMLALMYRPVSNMLSVFSIKISTINNIFNIETTLRWSLKRWHLMKTPNREVVHSSETSNVRKMRKWSRPNNKIQLYSYFNINAH